MYDYCAVMGSGFWVSYTLNFCELLLQICRAEEINIEGIIKGSVVHFHLVRTVVVHASGAISASGLGVSNSYQCV